MPGDDPSQKAFANGQNTEESIVKFEDNPSIAIHLQQVITPEAFEQWYRQREYARNIREGKPYFNGPGRINPPRRHSPSQLLQCKRKTVYRQEKAPKETEDPTGVFWVGTRIEDELILPFLEDTIANEDLYVTNSLWVDFHVETDAGEVQIKGSTDPVIVDTKSKPVLLFEVKTKRSLDNLNQPNTHHYAQAQAYLYGLNEKYDHSVECAIILYLGRMNLDFKAFAIKLDEAFWTNTVIPWLGDVTAYRLEQELPPADPEYDWECDFCSYKERCGKGERMFEDQPSQGLLPLFDYPKHHVRDHLEVHEDGKLTPTLAHIYPDLAREYDVDVWLCRGCETQFKWDEFVWDESVSRPIRCPVCEENGSTRYLAGPLPEFDPVST